MRESGDWGGGSAIHYPGGEEHVGTDGRPIVGYVSGVWDMFHVGHLNIIMRARARCDRLVVGVVSDGVVQRVKQHPPVIPLAERLDIIGGLRDVDAVIIDPYDDKFDSWTHLLHYDVLFKGDDWAATPRAELLQARLAEVGSRIEYFPYTAHTSSTFLRDVLTRLAHTPVEPHPESELSVPAGDRRCPACGRRTARSDQPAGPVRRFRTRVHLES